MPHLRLGRRSTPAIRCSIRSSTSITLVIGARYYGPAEFRGLFEDNDPRKRLLAVANVNHDLGEFWEFSDTGWVPVDLSNEAYKLRRELRDLRDDALKRRTGDDVETTTELMHPTTSRWPTG